MSEQHALLLQVLTSLHIGSGQPQAAIQNPLLRDPDSSLPQISASTLTGALRKSLRDSLYPEYAHQGGDWKQAANQDARVQQIFGDKEKPDSAGLRFEAGRLLALALRSAKGIWALVTSPARLQEFAHTFSQTLPEFPQPEHMQVFCASDHPGLLNAQHLLLEDLEFHRLDHWDTTWLTAQLKLSEAVSQRLLLISDQAFHIIVQSKTELMQFSSPQGHIQTVEFLPAESLLWSPILAQGDEQVSSFIQHCPRLIRLGGYQSLGKGFCHVSLLTLQKGN